MAEKKREIKVNFPEKLQGGVYANNMLIAHTKEEFMMDFIVVAPSNGVVTSRVITSPGHMKRIINALQENVKKYEDKFGVIEQAKEPEAKIGFQPH